MSDPHQAPGGRSDFRADVLLVPNLISLGRIAGVLVAAICIFAEYYVAAVALGLISGFSDYLDGYFARKLNQTSELGALLDSLADILAALICMTLGVYFRLWPVYLLLAWGIRDMAVLAMRASAAQQGFAIPTSFLGKVAMNFTGWAYMLLGFDLVRPFSGIAWLTEGLHWFALGAIHAGIALQWIVAIIYVRAYAARYRGNRGSGAVS
ncbi:MAG TPA: CDP-alcohol phosphatidyltransferase family protein [Kofleriaceae bacterium]|nr:CDP-alcohol phosphatidyltransferase family protein [Kofleriaceae bacterium]